MDQIAKFFKQAMFSGLLDYMYIETNSSETNQTINLDEIDSLDSYYSASEFNLNMTNRTIIKSKNITDQDLWKEDMKFAVDFLLLLLLILIMLAMGCEITIQQLWHHIRRPIGLTIGIVSQFGIKPVAAFAVLLASGVEGLHATGVLIISCCPGGVLSNTFTYFSDGDLPLSVAMTTASTIMAMGMLPANIWLYGRYFESVNLVIPYQKMAFSLCIVTSPIAVGMLMKWKLPRVAKWTTKIGTYTGLLLMFASVIIEIVIFPNMFTGVPLKLYAIILALPGIGLGLGYVIAAIMKQKVPVCKTIAIECGVQNFPLALTIIALSFPMEMQGDIVLLPWLYGFAMIVGCSILCGIYQLYKRYQKRKEINGKNVNGLKEGLDEPEKEDLMQSNGKHLPMKLCTVKLTEPEKEGLMKSNGVSVQIKPGAIKQNGVHKAPV
ncbi:ileal sodium/bile acid cotransporter-like isoform X1 [Argiope bruennichi]|uniref:ileal sodium/bile acid cotransporter-like isoform X1 n=1 Tax=Argiope bruennichi TaxID=94029 RepID=UPI0024944443|nr:ileal sodium/bile acid cotransporter-like isoform X1 [Argiope bruennichi]